MKNITKVVLGIATVAYGIELVREMKSVGASLKDLKTHGEIVSGTYTGERKTWTVNDITVIGVYSPVSVLASGALYASCNFDAYGHVVVVYDKNFTQLTEEEQYAVICHEAGHVHYQHDWRVRKLENEVQADAYAAAVVGRETMLSTLKLLMR